MQMRFVVLEARFYGVAQSRRRVFIWAASLEETIPEWPQSMHAFPTPQLRIKLDLEDKCHYSDVCSTKPSAPLRVLMVRDTIGDLPTLTNGDTLATMQIRLSNGRYADLKPQWLLRFQKGGTQSNGVLGILDWEKNFPTAITNPQPRGKVERWFHPVQNRMISVREYTQSQGFPKFVGTLKNKYQQVDNTVPPPLAFTLGRKLKEAMEANQ